MYSSISLPKISPMKCRARLVQMESPSGRRWERTAMRRLSRILSLICLIVSVLIFAAAAQELVDPVFKAQQRVQ